MTDTQEELAQGIAIFPLTDRDLVYLDKLFDLMVELLAEVDVEMVSTEHVNEDGVINVLLSVARVDSMLIFSEIILTDGEWVPNMAHLHVQALIDGVMAQDCDCDACASYRSSVGMVKG